MTITVLCALIGLGVLYVIAVGVIGYCVVRFRRTLTAAKQGHSAPAVAHAGVLGGLALILLNLGYQPPWPIDWNAQASSLSGWELYYVIVIAGMQMFTLAAAALFLADLVVVLVAIVHHERARLAGTPISSPPADHQTNEEQAR
ncbi:hypothetical protein [Mycolicibacterium mageritense]|uniref:hypothetical protein n=1 Tax=Mycolicibacterium mageritense TaxID=53462 RepID=UPI0011D68407|nr:hypothetical protein [Mycolicibacterium mageritense]TXI53499.1 MAG: hypothetical protein E6Q55_35025 [Mycolicibacterium mageritense]